MPSACIPILKGTLFGAYLKRGTLTMKTVSTLVLSASLLLPVAVIAAQSGQDPNAPAQNAATLNKEAQHNKMHENSAKAQEKRSKNASKADAKAAKKERKVEKDQQKAADANAAARPQ